MSRDAELPRAVARFEASLAALLDALQADAGSPAPLAQAHAECRASFESCRLALEAAGEDAALEPEVSAGLRRARRLQSVAVGLIETERTALARRLGRTRSARGFLDAQRAGRGPVGESCDVAG